MFAIFMDPSHLRTLTPIRQVYNCVFTVAKRFFNKHKNDCELWALSDDDFDTVVRLCLASDTIVIGDKGYKQISGLAMGNNLAPTLAIIYMNEPDTRIVERSNGCAGYS